MNDCHDPQTGQFCGTHSGPAMSPNEADAFVKALPWKEPTDLKPGDFIWNGRAVAKFLKVLKGGVKIQQLNPDGSLGAVKTIPRTKFEGGGFNGRGFKTTPTVEVPMTFRTATTDEFVKLMAAKMTGIW